MKLKFLNICLIPFIFSLTLAENYRWSPSVDFVLKMIMKQDYQSAYHFCDSSIAKKPMDIDARYLKVVTMQSQLADYESYVLDGVNCISLAESTLVYVNNKLETKVSGDEKMKLIFYKGNILGVLSIIKAKKGIILPSIKDAYESYDMFKNVKKATSVFPDVLYGLGLFDYYIGDNLKWIPGLGKKAQKGLDLLYTAANSESPFHYAAKNSLLWILIERGEYATADSIASEVLKIYPQNTLFMQIKSRAALGSKQYKKAIDLGEDLIGISLNRKPVNWSDVLSGYQLISACWIKLDNKQKAKESACKGLSHKISTDTLKIEWVQKHREYLLSIQ